MKLFISYAHVDRYRVNELVEILRDAGYEPWFDHRLLPGQDWKAELLRAVKMCDAFLYALSPESVESEWCQWEFAQAVEMGKPIIPVLLQARTKLPDAISRFQFADFSDGPTPRSVARLMGGLRVVQVIVPVAQAPQVTANPSGIPAQAENDGAIASPSFTPPDVSHILPPPFEWCYVPRGFVTLEDASNRKPPGTKGGKFEVSDFYIAKYPITNKQYQTFVNARDGWQRLYWWEYSDEAMRWREKQPNQMNYSLFADNCPCVNISWYESLAFCWWLNSHLSQITSQITLPTEQQWQYAAQGDKGWKYPWGNNFDSQLCNTSENNINKPTPVTQYPNGMGTYGVFDMSGNVWEWCLTIWGTDKNDLGNDMPRVVRGGSWNRNSLAARSTTRRRSKPTFEGSGQGFRIVCTSF